MPPVEFEPTISAGERPQTYALDRAVSGEFILYVTKFPKMSVYILLHRVLYLESYLNCTEDLACTSRPPNGSVNFFCVM
jgi:hypothetical protein